MAGAFERDIEQSVQLVACWAGLPTACARAIGQDIAARVALAHRLLLDDLPLDGDAARVAKIVGRAGLVSLILARGGARWYCPRQGSGRAWLESLLGRDRARALTAEFGGVEIALASVTTAATEGRRQAIRAHVAAGGTESEAARLFGLNWRSVRRICGPPFDR